MARPMPGMGRGLEAILSASSEEAAAPAEHLRQLPVDDRILHEHSIKLVLFPDFVLNEPLVPATAPIKPVPRLILSECQCFIEGRHR